MPTTGVVMTGPTAPTPGRLITRDQEGRDAIRLAKTGVTTLEKREAGFCFYCAAGYEVSAWGPSPAKPAGHYRMDSGYRRTGGPDPCGRGCPKEVEFATMRGYSTHGRGLSLVLSALPHPG